MEDLATDYDIIVVGTGFTECLVAAASARVGKKVLHIDQNDFYGGPWASFNLLGIQDWIENISKKDSKENTDFELLEGETFQNSSNPNRIYSNVFSEWHLPLDIPETNSVEDPSTDTTEDNNTESPVEEETKDKLPESKSLEKLPPKIVAEEPTYKCQKDLLKLHRKFNLDLTAKLLYSRGLLVELLISSNVSRYTEFKCTTRILTWLNSSGEGKLKVVPCSRTDVFKTNELSLIEKRLLMKFLQSCHNYLDKKEQWQEFENDSFLNFLKSFKLTPNLIHYVTEAIAMVTPDASFHEGLKRLELFLSSLGRFGASPFLYSMYGCGELPQAFCRLCAVFEGTYVLRRGIDAIVMDKDNNASCVVSEGVRLNCTNLVLQSSVSPSSFTQPDLTQKVSRGIFITNKSILSDDGEQLTLLRFPKDSNICSPITVLEVGYTAGVSPKNLYVVHMTCDGSDAKGDLASAVQRLFSVGDDDDKPDLLWSLYFNQESFVKDTTNNIPSNVYFCSSPDSQLDYDYSIEQAKSVFKEIYPEEEFLPRAPDPEEIKFDDDGDDAMKENATDADSANLEEKLEADPTNLEDNIDVESTNLEKKLKADSENLDTKNNDSPMDGAID